MSAPPETCAILAIGDELTTGQSIDTNSAWLSERLGALGWRVVRHATVPDDDEAIASELLRLGGLARVIVATGGLGPTKDDLTRAGLARACVDELVEDAAQVDRIEAFFRAFGRQMPESNRVQAMRPSKASALDNDHGTAPGLSAKMTVDGSSRHVWCLPGPPPEMRPMFERAVEPALGALRGDGPAHVVRARTLRTFGLGESDVAERLGALMDRSRNPVVGTTASGGVVTCRARFEGPASACDAALDAVTDEVRRALRPYVYGEDDQTLASTVAELLIERGERVVVVESCTGGMLGSMLADQPGVSACFLGGWITYDNAMKRSEVNVPEALLRTEGAVSEAVARALAEGGLVGASEGKADHALAITGVAGPDGGSDDKPVGTVWIARASRGENGAIEAEARRFHFPGNRQAVRRRSALTALMTLRLHLLGEHVGALLREQTGGEG